MNFHISKIKEEFLVIIFFVLIIIFDLFVPAEFYGAYTLLGYFSGYATLRHLPKKIQEKIIKKQEPISFLLGLITLSILGLIAYNSTGIISQILFFTAGLFVTILWPLLSSKLFSEKNTTIKKSKKTR
jgi:hypothetical protein